MSLREYVVIIFVRVNLVCDRLRNRRRGTMDGGVGGSMLDSHRGPFRRQIVDHASRNWSIVEDGRRPTLPALPRDVGVVCIFHGDVRRTKPPREFQPRDNGNRAAVLRNEIPADCSDNATIGCKLRFFIYPGIYHCTTIRGDITIAFYGPTMMKLASTRLC